MIRFTVAAVAGLVAFGIAQPASAGGGIVTGNNPLGNFFSGAGAGYGTAKVFGADDKAARIIGGVGGAVNVLTAPPPQPQYAPPPPTYYAAPPPPTYYAPPPPRYTYRRNPPPAVYQPAYSAELVSRLQSGLNYLGYNAGPVDGAYGGLTNSAIRGYQSDNDLYVDGRPSEELYAHMSNFLPQ